MRTRRAALVAALCLVLSALMTPPATAASPAPSTPAAAAKAPQAPAVTKTKVKKVSPFTKKGTLRAKLSYGVEEDIATCVPSMVATGKGVYECGPSAAYLPACWVTSGTEGLHAMVCMRSPLKKKVVSWIFYEGPDTPSLPAARPLAKPMPWLIVLDNGARCSVRLGGAWGEPPEGYEYSYSCSGSGPVDVLLTSASGQTLITTSKHFAVRGTSLDGSSPIRTVGVKKVFYAGAAPKAAKAAAKSGKACVSRSTLNSIVQAKHPRLRAIGKVSCAGKWALVGTTDGIAGGYALFHKAHGNWILRHKDALCMEKKGMPAAFAWSCFVG